MSTLYQAYGSCSQLAYRQIASSADVSIVYLPGLLSTMDGRKSRALQAYAVDRGFGYVCFDYKGHGESSGKFVDCTMRDFVGNAMFVLENMCKDSERVILVGSSLGAWVGLWLALSGGSCKIDAVVGVGSAVDFTRSIFGSLTAKERDWLAGGQHVSVTSPYLDDPYPFTGDLYRSGEEYLLLGKDDTIESKCPVAVRLLHGSNDDVVSCASIQDTVGKLRSSFRDIELTVVEHGDHRLSRNRDIDILVNTIDKLALSTYNDNGLMHVDLPIIHLFRLRSDRKQCV